MGVYLDGSQIASTFTFSFQAGCGSILDKITPSEIGFEKIGLRIRLVSQCCRPVSRSLFQSYLFGVADSGEEFRIG